MKLFIKRILSDATRSIRVPLPISITLEIISTLQLVHLILRVMTNYSEEKAFFVVDLLNYWLSYIGQLSPTGLFGESESVLKYIWVIFAAYFAIHIILLLYIFLFWKIHRGAKQIRLLHSMHWLYLVHSRYIFFVAHFFFIGLLNLYNSGRSLVFYTKLAFFLPTVIFCVLNASLAIIKELLLYQLLKSRDSYCVKNNLYHQVVLAHKGILIFIYFFVQDQPANAQVCTILHVAFTILTLMALYMKFPFYNISLMKTSIVLNGVMMAFCLLGILQILHVNKKVLDLVLLAIIPLVVKSSLIGFRTVSSKIMKGEFDTPEKALYYISLLKQNKFGYLASSLFEENAQLGTILSKGVLIQQKFDVSRLKDSESKKEYEEKIYQHLFDRLSTILEKNPSSKLLLLTMASVCLKKLDNIPKTIILIKRLESQGLNIPANTSLDAFNLKLKQFHTRGDFDEDERALKLMNYFKYKEKAIALQQVMKQEVTGHIELWEGVKREHLDVKKIMDTAVIIDKSSALVQKIFESQFREFTQYFVNPLMLYGAYLELVKEYSDDARKLIKQFWSFTRSQARSQGIDVYCEEVGIVVISIEKNNLGNIVDASGSMQTLFQIDKQRILGKQITTLLPDFMANHLNKIIKNYAKTPSRKLDHQFLSYGKMLDGNYFEVQIQLKLFPKTDREVKLMLLFRKIAPPKPILILNHDGMIIEGTESLKQNLNITNPKNSAKEVFMRFQDIAPDFERVNTAFNQEYNAEQGVGLEILKTISSKLPSVVSSKFYNASNTTPKGGLTKQESLALQLRDSKRNNSQQAKYQNQDTSMELLKDLCNEYIQGTKIGISKTGHTFNSSLRNEVVYDIRVIPCQVNGSVYKTLILTNATDEEKQPSYLLPFIPKESTLPMYTKISEKSEFAEEFPDENERSPQISTAKFANYKATVVGKRVTLVSDDSSNPVNQKPSLKTPDLDPFIKAHAPTKGRLLAKIPEQEHSISSTSSRTIASVKALKSIFGTGRIYPISRRTTIVMVLLVLLMIGLGGYNYIVSRSAANQVKAGIGIVNTSSLRLSFAMRGWQFATRLWLRHIKLRSGQIASLKTSMLNAGLEMLQYNKEFNAELSALTDKDLIEEINAEDVNMWELNQTYTTNGGPTTSFTASNIIANKMVMIGNTTMSTESAYILEQTLYLCNNTCNDYLVSSENLIAATQRMLQDVLSRNINSLQLILGLEIGTVGVICIVLLVSSRLVIEQYHKLFRCLVRIDENYITERLYQVQKMRALLNEDIEVRGYGVSIIEESKEGLNIRALEKAKEGKSNVFRKGVFQKRSGRLVLRGMFVEIAKYSLVSLIFIQIVTALFIVSLSESLSNFRSSQDVTSQLAITTKAAYTSSVIISTVYMDMDFRNMTGMFVRNQAPVSQIAKVISEFNDVNTDLISVFSKNGVGITDPLVNELFESTICKYLAQDATTQTYCVNATNYGQLGVLAINSKLLQTENYYVDKWLANPTYNTAFGMLDAYILIMRPAAETLQAAYEFINAHLVGKFDQATQDFLDKITVLHIGILIAVIFSTVIMQKVTINRFELLDRQRGDILKTMSYKMLLEDKAVGFYLNRHFVNANGVLSKTL